MAGLIGKRTRRALRVGLPLSAAVLILAVWPARLPEPPWSPTLLAADGSLLHLRLAADGQWRLPPSGAALPDRYVQALMAYEDGRFLFHPGIDPAAVLRAAWQNLRAGRVVAGGSTLTMQLARLTQGQGHSRSLSQKLREALWALRFELRHSKREVLEAYALRAPFGGNQVGFETAMWRYFGRPPGSVSWGEAALLAVLPNAPGLLYPGDGQRMEALKHKRDALLQRLQAEGRLDSLTAALARAEPLPGGVLGVPRAAPHLADSWPRLTGRDASHMHSTLDRRLQTTVERLVEAHVADLRGAEIRHVAALVADISTGAVRAYVGNTPSSWLGGDRAGMVDIIPSPRSPGSLLKPFLYAAWLQTGELFPRQLVPDLPSYYRGWTPQNFDRRHAGAVPADEALIRSLNVPAANLLADYGVPRFLGVLHTLGFASLREGAGHYGLSLILGGGEVSLWELAGAYLYLGQRVALHQSGREGAPHRPLHLDAARADGADGADGGAQDSERSAPFGPGAAWLTLQALAEVVRPDEWADWRHFASSRTISWKTGTSIGFRDAWAIGQDGRHLVAVWTGNAEGEGRPELIGVHTAAPLMFHIFNALPHAPEMEPPHDDLVEAEACVVSGRPPGPHCPRRRLLRPDVPHQAMPCDFHQPVLVESGRRVRPDCAGPGARPDTAFVMPAAWTPWIRAEQLGGRPLPPWSSACTPGDTPEVSPLAWIYPRASGLLRLPISFEGGRGGAVFQLGHRRADMPVHWHLDERYLATTRGDHRLEVSAAPGLHVLEAVDSLGHRARRQFEVLGGG